MAAGGADRERDRVPPYDAVRPIGAPGSARCASRPARRARPSLRELFAFVIRLSEADPNVAQSVRAHYHFVEGRLAAADPWASAPAGSPRSCAAPVRQRDGRAHDARPCSGSRRRYPRDGDGYVCAGRSTTRTGSLYADQVAVAAVARRRVVSVSCPPTARAWGSRTTGTGWASG